MNKTKRTPLYLSAILGALSLASMQAANVTWSGGSSGAGIVLTTASNWVGSVAPSPGDNVVFTGSIGNSGPYIYLTTTSGSSVVYQTMTFDNLTDSPIFGANSSNTTPPARTITLSGANAGITVSGTTSPTITFGRQVDGFGGTLGIVLTDTTAINVASSGAELIFSNTAVVSGAGSIVKTGDGALLMGRYNTFSGGFTMSAGTVITNFPGASDLSVGPLGVGTVTLTGGNLQSVSASSRTYYNNVVLSGSVAFGTASGNGSGAQTFASSTGVTQTTIASDSTLNTIADLTWNQNIVSSGSSYQLTKNGAGTLTLSGTNTGIGGFTVNSGTLALSSLNAANPNTVATPNQGYFTLNGGTLQFNFTINSTPLSGNRGFTLGAQGGTISVSSTNTMNARGTFVESAAGATLTKVGSGTFIMANGTSSYTGATTVSEGTLLIDANATLATSNVSVASGATFGGLGHMGGTLTVAGNLAPGVADTTGTLTVANSLTLLSSASVQLSLGDAATYDSIAGITNLTLDGTITVSLINGYTPDAGTTFSLLGWTGSLDASGFNLATDLLLPTLGNGLSWDTSSFLTNGTITAVPEPGSVALSALGLAFVLRQLRRRK